MARRGSTPRRVENQRTRWRGGILLLAVSKTKEPDGEEEIPPRRVENQSTRWRGGDLLLAVLKTKEPDGEEENSSSPCQKQKTKTVRRNSPPRRVEYQRTR